MTTHARVENGIVVELFENATGRPMEELFHPELTWIAVSASVAPPEIGWTYDGTYFGEPAQAEPDIAALVKQKVESVRCYLDAGARLLGYDDIATAVSYADEPAVPEFQAEGKALREWRSLVWAKANQTLAAVGEGEMDMPSDEVFLSQLAPAPITVQ